MAHPDDYRYYLEIGCEDISHSLGMQKMPEGYVLMLDADRMFYFGMELATGKECGQTWDKWGVYRWAKKRSAEARATGQQEGDSDRSKHDQERGRG